MPEYHEAVLVNQSIKGLNISENTNGIYVDVTFGAGTHSRAILQQLGSTGQLFSFDQDPDATNNIQDVLLQDDRFTFIAANFAHLQAFLRIHNVMPGQVAGILADLGVSWHQFNTPSRGFSIRFDNEILDMRMNKEDKQRLTAAEVLSTYSEEELARVFSIYGQLPGSYRLAATIIRQRTQSPITTALALKNVAMPVAQSKARQHTTKYFAQLFQALRIEVNQEMQVLENLLEQATAMLKPGGRMAIISYHSLEDKLVKNYFRAGNFSGKEEKDLYGISKRPLEPINRKVIIPDKAELENNPKSRSAKLRIAEKNNIN